MEKKIYPFDLAEDLERTVKNVLSGIEKASGKRTYLGLEPTDDDEKFVVHIDTLHGKVQMTATKEGRWMGHWNLKLADGTESEMPAFSLDSARPFWKRILALCVAPVDWLKHRMASFDTAYFYSDDGAVYRQWSEEFDQIRKEIGKLSESDKRRLRGAQNAEQWGIK